MRVEKTSFDGRCATTTVRAGAESWTLSLSARQPLAAPRAFGDVWAPLALFAAMRLGVPLELDDPVSHRLQRGLLQVQEILATWDPGLTTVPVQAPSPAKRAFDRRSTRAMQTFTGGVDSFFTLGRRTDVDTLVYVHDLVHDVPEVRERISGHLGSVAASEGKRLVEVDSDVRTLLDRFGEWGAQTHGAALASVAAFTGAQHAEAVIPGSHTYLELEPWGSHPLLDPCWSGDRVQVVHHGAGFTRFQKVREILGNPVARTHLRVCWQTTSRINCSRCEKCLRTMTALDLLGALDRVPTFEGPLDPAALESLDIPDTSTLNFTLENRRAAEAAGRTDVVTALDVALARHRG